MVKMQPDSRSYLIQLLTMAIVLLWGVEVVRAQFPGHAWRQLDQNAGISELQNAFFTSDHFGRVWISSVDGLNCFNGIENTTFRFQLPGGQSDPIVSSPMFKDAADNLWCTTTGGIQCLKKGSFEVETWQIALGPNAKPAAHHMGIHLEHDSLFWVIADAQLFQFNIQSKKYQYLHDLNAVRAYPLLNPSGDVAGLAVSFFDLGIEIIRYPTLTNPKRTRYFEGKDKRNLPTAKVYNYLVQGDSLAWIPADIGLIRFNLLDESYQIIKPEKSRKPPHFSDACLWNKDFLWLSSIGQGIFLYSIRDRQFIENHKFVWVGNQAHDVRMINNLAMDQNGTLWLANWKKEILHTNLSSLKFQHQLKKENPDLPAKEVTAITGDAAGNIWCAINRSGLARLKNLKANGMALRNAQPDFFPAFTSINHVYTDDKNRIWQLSKGSVSFFEPGTGRFHAILKGDDDFRKILPLSQEQFLLVTYSGFTLLEKESGLNKITRLGFDAPLFDGLISFFASRQGRIFVSTSSNQLFELQIKGNQIIVLQKFSNVGYVNDLLEDATGNCLWLASSSGILKLNLSGQKPVETILDSELLLSRAFNAILQDDSGALWLSSNAGIFKYAPKTQEIRHYTESDGLQGMQFMLGSACKLPDGRLAFGGVNGLNIFHPLELEDNQKPPLLHFTKWVVNDTDTISLSPEYLDYQTFRYDRRTLTFHFTGIDFNAPDEVRYRYRLKGLDAGIVNGGATRLVRYAQLPPGAYTFQVWAANSDGIWTTNPHELHFTILPPWYLTWWAIAVWVLMGIGLLYAVYRNQVASIKRQEAERRKEAENKQLAAELQNSVLRLQMNPHFIFNSMNSISSYILQKDINTANDYLARFAKLMRLILDLASRPLIPVADEIELLEQYMSVEAMRFEQRFAWKITIDEAIDPDDVVLPTMILQPFVENAIWHGISDKVSAGQILIGFNKLGESMVCTIEDNGVGRRTSQLHKTVQHGSKAVQITEQRLMLLESLGHANSKLLIHDLYDESGLSRGTRVEIVLPLDL